LLDNKKYKIWGILAFLVILGTIATYYFVRNTPFMKRSLLLTAEFESISTLRLGTRVYFYGMEVGKVHDIYLNPENGHIMVDFDVKSGISVPHNAEAVAYVPSIMYSARLEIRFQADGTQEFLENGDIIPGSVGSYILDMKKQLDPYAKMADSMVMALFPSKDSARQIIESAEASISQFYRASSGMSKSLRSNEKSIESSLTALEKLTADLDNKEGSINKMVLKLNKATGDAAKTNYTTSLSKLHPDSIQIPDIGQYSAKISAISKKMEQINSGVDTSLYKLVYDEKFKQKVIDKNNSLKMTFRDIREHPEENIRIIKKK